MLKKIRVTASIIIFVLITFYMLDFADLLPEKLGLLAKIQFVPALLALNLAVITAIIGLTLIFGRVYCSSICPMGIYQDIVAWISKRFNKKKRYSFSKAKTTLRWLVLAVTAIGFLFGFTFLLGLLDPYGAYGRMTTHLFRPAYLAGNNLLASIFNSFNNYTLSEVSIYFFGIFSTIIALITFVVIGFMAWKHGRTYCNTICPVGTALGLLSKFSLFKVQFVEDSCNMCGLCSMKCKASCIDSEKKQIDYSRCVNCFNCIDVCNRKAMKYMPVGVKKGRIARGIPAYRFEKEKKTVDVSKRQFLTSTLAVSVATGKLMAQQSVNPLHKSAKRTAVAPPGSLSHKHLREKCISCHLCVSKCPSHVIKPALLEYGLGGVMQPKLVFDDGFCDYNCTICGSVCPTGAIQPLSAEVKQQTQIGRARFVKQNCVIYTEDRNCGACADQCPTKAIRMVAQETGTRALPQVSHSACIGCGACEYVCPAVPDKAIYVEGSESHHFLNSRLS